MIDGIIITWTIEVLLSLSGKKMRSEWKGGNSCNQGHGEDLDEGGWGLVVGEGDVEVSEVGAIGVVLKLSSGSQFTLRVAVLDTGDANPEVSVDAIAIVPLAISNGSVGWTMDAEVLSGFVGDAAVLGVSHMVKLPATELFILGKVILEGPSNVEVFSNHGVVDSVEELRVSTGAGCAVGARAIDGEVNNGSANREFAIFWEINEVWSAIVN